MDFDNMGRGRNDPAASRHPRAAGRASLNDLALRLAEKGETTEAETLMREGISMWRETMGDAHPDVGDGLMSLGTHRKSFPTRIRTWQGTGALTCLPRRRA